METTKDTKDTKERQLPEKFSYTAYAAERFSHDLKNLRKKTEIRDQ